METIGLDIDENGKPTAVAAVTTEGRKEPGARWRRGHRDVWVLESLSASSYDEAVRRVAEIVDEATRRAPRYQPTLYGNVTGTGKAVLGALRGKGVRAKMKPVYLTPGDERTEKDDGVRLGTGWLVSRLQDLLQNDRFHLLDAVGAEELKQELLDYRHTDDSLGSLMTALGLAAQDEWSGILGVVTFGGPGSEKSYRNPRADRAIREALDRLSWSQ